MDPGTMPWRKENIGPWGQAVRNPAFCKLHTARHHTTRLQACKTTGTTRRQDCKVKGTTVLQAKKTLLHSRMPPKGGRRISMRPVLCLSKHTPKSKTYRAERPPFFLEFGSKSEYPYSAKQSFNFTHFSVDIRHIYIYVIYICVCVCVFF